MSNQLTQVIINGQEFSLYTDYFNHDTMTWQKDPERQLDGSMPGINDIERFPAPILWLDFGFITISDYRRLMAAIRPAEFVVTFYNIEMDTLVSHKMYAHPLQRNTIHNYGKNLIGVRGLAITLVGTLNDNPEYSISFNLNGATTGTVPTETGYYGSKIAVPSASEIEYPGHTFYSWNTRADGTGAIYTPGNEIFLIGNQTLYAIWQAQEMECEIIEISEPRTFSFDFQPSAPNVATYRMLYIKRTAQVPVAWSNVNITEWAYGEIPLLPLNKVQKVLIETLDGVAYKGTGGDYFDEAEE